jgi:hypothetical protein
MRNVLIFPVNLVDMKKLTALFLFISFMASGQVKLSDQAEISVLTLGPWHGQVYTAFGHSAFRVFDPVNQIDDAYNYGVFDYDRPNFYLNFAKGHNVYKLGVMDYRRFEYSYIYYDRYIHEQKLNLSAQQKQRLFDFLQWNARPENEEYLYDYFYDNCATKMPEVLNKVFGDTIRFDSVPPTPYTIRQLTDIYLKHQPWGDFGIDICLGLPMDKQASAYEHMFLPDFVEAGLAKAKIMKSGRPYPLVKETIVRHETQHPIPEPSIFSPLVVFSILFVIIALVSYRDIKTKKLTTWLDAVLFSIVGFLGLIFFLLWVATDHRAAARNLNLLWALPTHLVAVVAFIRNPRWLTSYFLVVAILSLLLLASWLVLPQQLHYALIPLVMALGVRAYTQYLIRKQEMKQQTTSPVPAKTEP